MKYLKRFDEELDPDKYVKVGLKLKDLGKDERGIKLIDYGSEKKWGLYNILYTGSTQTKGVATNLKCNFHFGIPQWVDRSGNSTTSYLSKIKMEGLGLNEEQLLMNWSNGESVLGFTLDFRFEPTEHTKKGDSSSFTDDDIPLIETGLPLFSIIVKLSYWSDGLVGYNTIEDDNGVLVELKPGNPNYNNVIKMYDQTNIINIFISPVFNHSHNGIFADRQSALKFKRKLPNFVNEHKSKIMDLLSVLNSDSDRLENIIENINNIGINYFYHDNKSNPFSFNKIYNKLIK